MYYTTPRDIVLTAGKYMILVIAKWDNYYDDLAYTFKGGQDTHVRVISSNDLKVSYLDIEKGKKMWLSIKLKPN